MNKPRKGVFGAMLRNLVGRDLAGMAISWAKILKRERIPFPHPPSYGKYRGGVRKLPRPAVRSRQCGSKALFDNEQLHHGNVFFFFSPLPRRRGGN